MLELDTCNRVKTVGSADTDKDDAISNNLSSINQSTLLSDKPPTATHTKCIRKYSERMQYINTCPSSHKCIDIMAMYCKRNCTILIRCYFICVMLAVTHKLQPVNTLSSYLRL